jgi:hypothetical protein
MRMRRFVIGAGVAFGAVGLTAGGAFAGAQLITKPAPAVKGIVGILNPPPVCSQQFASTRYSAAPVTNGCAISIPKSAIPAGHIPIGIISPTGGNVTSITQTVVGSDWVIKYTMTLPVPVNFSIEESD